VIYIYKWQEPNVVAQCLAQDQWPEADPLLAPLAVLRRDPPPLLPAVLPLLPVLLLLLPAVLPLLPAVRLLPARPLPVVLPPLLPAVLLPLDVLLLLPLPVPPLRDVPELPHKH
jgi:hypothetical protein